MDKVSVGPRGLDFSRLNTALRTPPPPCSLAVRQRKTSFMLSPPRPDEEQHTFHHAATFPCFLYNFMSW